MKTIFWLAIVFGALSAFVIGRQAAIYAKLSPFEKLYSKPGAWPYPVLLACIVVALTV